MRVLVVGSGGREHALAWAIAASPLTTKLWAAPGNPGTATVAENVHIEAEDVDRAGAVRPRARDRPGGAGAGGAAGGRAGGRAGARRGSAAAGRARRRRSSRAARASPRRSATPPGSRPRGGSGSTAPEEAIEFVRRRGAPIVVKADGLAAGKGVVVAATVEEAEAAIHSMMRDRAFGEAGAAVVIEECLDGRGGQPVRAVRRHGCGVPGRGAGPQAGRRRRYRAEHRRHGRGGAGAGLRPGGRHGGASSARRWPRWRGAARRSAACCSPG